MLQDVNHTEASCIFHVKVGTFHQLVQTAMCVMSVTSFEIVLLTVYHDLIVSICFISDPGNFLKYTLPDVLSVKECHVFISQ